MIKIPRTLTVCLTAWAVFTEAMVLDYIKFDAKRELLEQAARALGKTETALTAPASPRL